MNKVALLLQKNVRLPDTEEPSIQDVADLEYDSKDGRIPDIVIYGQRGFALIDMPNVKQGVYEEVLTAIYNEPTKETPV